MNSVDRIKAICKERNIPLYKLEQDLGFSNGYIGQLRKGVLRADRLRMVAEYLSVSPEYLMGDDQARSTPTQLNDQELKFALWGSDANQVSDSELEDVKRYAAYIVERKKSK